MTATLFLLLLCLLAFVSSLSAIAYVQVLTQPEHILSFWAKFLYGLRDSYAARFGPEGSGRHEKAYNRAAYVLQPILTCPYCVAGQLSLWGYLYAVFGHGVPYLLAAHVATVFVSVGLTKLTSSLWSQ